MMRLLLLSDHSPSMFPYVSLCYSIFSMFLYVSLCFPMFPLCLSYCLYLLSSAAQSPFSSFFFHSSLAVCLSLSVFLFPFRSLPFSSTRFYTRPVSSHSLPAIYRALLPPFLHLCLLNCALPHPSPLPSIQFHAISGISTSVLTYARNRLNVLIPLLPSRVVRRRSKELPLLHSQLLCTSSPAPRPSIFTRKAEAGLWFRVVA